LQQLLAKYKQQGTAPELAQQQIQQLREKLLVNTKALGQQSTEANMSITFKIIDDIFDIALYVLNPVETDLTVVFDKVVALDKKLTNVFDGTNYVDPIATITSTAAGVSRGGGNENGLNLDKKSSFIQNEYKCFKEEYQYMDESDGLLDYNSEIGAFCDYIFEKEKKKLIKVGLCTKIMLNAGKALHYTQKVGYFLASTFGVAAGLATGGFGLAITVPAASGGTLAAFTVLNKIILTAVTRFDNVLSEEPDFDYDCHNSISNNNKSVIFINLQKAQDAIKQGILDTVKSKRRKEYWTHVKAALDRRNEPYDELTKFEQSISIEVQVIFFTVPENKVNKQQINLAERFYTQQKYYNMDMVAMWYYIFYLFIYLDSSGVDGCQKMYDFLTNDDGLVSQIDLKNPSLLQECFSKFFSQSPGLNVKSGRLFKKIVFQGNLYVQERMKSLTNAFLLVRKRFLKLKEKVNILPSLLPPIPEEEPDKTIQFMFQVNSRALSSRDFNIGGNNKLRKRTRRHLKKKKISRRFKKMRK
jgi:hypothetical protein